MGEWSEYFDDFPEENPANYVNGKFDPQRAEELRRQQFKLSAEQAALNDEIAAIVRKHREAKQSK